MDLPKIDIGKKDLTNINTALNTEWIITNGLGGYASSSVLGVNTRKYHGLLVAAFNPPVNRWVMLTKLDETIKIENKNYDLSTNEFKDTTYPKGYTFLSNFSLEPLPTYRYDIKGVCLEKTVFMPYLQNATIISYNVSNPLEEKISIYLSPLVNSRHIYNTTNKNKIGWNFCQKSYEDAIVIEPSDSFSSLILSSSDNSSFVKETWWIEKMFFRIDASRSENNTDDSFRPGRFEFSVHPEETKKFHVLAVAGKNNFEAQSCFSSFGKELVNFDSLYHQELTRRKKLLEKFKTQNPGLEFETWLKWLVQAADSFIVSRRSTQKKSVLAGYHWFDDWGRDSLISLPGLTLVTGKFEDAQEILLTFEQYCNKGIIPNRFSDKAGDIPLYNTVDATLWFFNAVLQYLKYTNDFDFVQKKLWHTLNQIVDYHIQGTIFGIHMDKDSLIAHGPQLTWMDATTIDNFVTPRNGKAVEIQALWYNSLKTMQLLSERFNQVEKSEEFKKLAEKTKDNFVKLFWNNQKGYLVDVITEDVKDETLRPNQTIAVSLDFSLLDLQKSVKIVEMVWKHLWGTFGLKTLPKTDFRYQGKYIGNWDHRDNAYHNGTVWAWLLGPFVTAFLKTKNHDKQWREYAFENFLKPLFQIQLSQSGLGTISEIFDGNKPHTSRGCISQAWSVAEPLRAYIEDITLNRPQYEKEIVKLIGE
ncbi:amylo-alpha-1,6-glucosidase [Candidatus Bathyarchaeota archaeon]|nr:amylo-alpha-1,6-glucosidase [Candidatus Bathyarchaeota archaeon]